MNNRDLVDTSAPTVGGGHLEQRDRSPLYDWARSSNLWQRRIAILATFRFIRNQDCADTLAIARLLLFDEEDLIHKAVGWMLREVGNRDTMLRHAIEKFPERLHQRYLRSSI